MTGLATLLLQARPFDPPLWADILIVSSCAVVFAVSMLWGSRKW